MTAQPKPTAAAYVPTTDEVETAFHEFASALEAREPGTYPDAPEFADWREAMHGFRRWLAEHDAQVAAQALRDAAASAPSALGITSGSRIEVGVRAAAWLRARADRIAGGAT